MATGGVSSVYLHVIDDVIGKVRDEFIRSGSGDAVLGELQAIWEAKLMQCGVLTAGVPRPVAARAGGGAAAAGTPVHDLNVPYEGPFEEYETPTAEMLFPPTPLQTPIQTPLPGIAEHQMYQAPTPGDFLPSGSEGRDVAADVKGGGRPSPYMQPPSPWMNQRPLGVDVNVAYVEARDDLERGASHQSLTQDFFMPSAGKRKRDAFTSQFNEGYIPQQDGSGDCTLEFISPEASKRYSVTRPVGDRAALQSPPFQQNISSHSLPQMDGNHDDYSNSFHSQEIVTEDYSTPFEHDEFRAPTPLVGTPKLVKTETADDEEPPLNEDDDDLDDLDDSEQGEDEQYTQHLVLAQFEKVSRTKSRWKCTLKDGIMHLNGRDILFTKANGEFDF